MQQSVKDIINFIQLVSLQILDYFSQTKLYWKVLNKGFLYIYKIYKSDNRLLRYQTISNHKFHWLLFQKQLDEFT